MEKRYDLPPFFVQVIMRVFSWLSAFACFQFLPITIFPGGRSGITENSGLDYFDRGPGTFFMNNCLVSATE